MLALSISALVLTITFGSASPKPSYPVLKSNNILINYVWYEDPDLTVPTGTASDVNTELNRLRTAFPGYTFSTIHSMGLYEFEYGYYSGFSMVKIFSDM